MFKVTMSKIKKICSIALIPRILRDEISLSPKKLGKRPLDGLWKMSKSTDSKDREAECEKCKKIIEMVFGSEKPNNVLNNVEANIEDIHMDKIQKAIAPNIAVDGKSNEPDRLKAASLLPVEGSYPNKEKELEYNETISTDDALQTTTKKHIDHTTLPLDNLLKSTTAKTEEEQLAQKIETIEEPGLVDATTPKVDGFNTSAKVLGDKGSVDKQYDYLCTKIAPEQDAMDEIAKKCLGSPPDKIDEHILEEMKSCGMLGRGRRKPTSRNSRYHNVKSNEKEPLSETKSKQSAVYLKNQQKLISPLHDYPRMRNHNMKIAHKIQNAYFKNMSLNLIGDGNSDRKTNAITIEQKDEKPDLGEEKAKLGSPQAGSVVDQKTEQIYNFHTEVPEKVLRETITYEEKPKEAVENVEVEVEEMRVTAAETSRLGVPVAIELKPDVDANPIKPDVLPCNQMLQAIETPLEEKSFEPDNRERVVFAEPNRPTNSPLDIPDQPFNTSNTAISGTYPLINPEPATSRQDTAISSVQNPAEFYDISHCYMEKLGEDCAISPSTIRPLAAYHPYTIISSTEGVTEPENILFATKDTPNVLSPELDGPVQIEIQDVPKTMNQNISATMGPLPELNDPVEEVSLSEMLRRVRERNRFQYIRECDANPLQVEPAEANKCHPPLDKGPAKTLGPGPCKPKPKPACPPPSPPCPPPPTPPCKPKDPCAKFTKSSLIIDRIKETFTVVLQVAFKSATPLFYRSNISAVKPLKQTLINEDYQRIEKLSSFLLSSRPVRKTVLSDNEDVILARDYGPWAPMPSWPIPEKEKKERFVCPKEGCKIIPPPRLNPPCKENPCINLPKRKFSLIVFEFEPLYSTTLYDDEF